MSIVSVVFSFLISPLQPWWRSCQATGGAASIDGPSVDHAGPSGRCFLVPHCKQSYRTTSTPRLSASVITYATVSRKEKPKDWIPRDANNFNHSIGQSSHREDSCVFLANPKDPSIYVGNSSHLASNASASSCVMPVQTPVALY